MGSNTSIACHFVFHGGQSQFTAKLTNQSVQKVLFTCVIYTTNNILLFLMIREQLIKKSKYQSSRTMLFLENNIVCSSGQVKMMGRCQVGRQLLSQILAQGSIRNLCGSDPENTYSLKRWSMQHQYSHKSYMHCGFDSFNHHFCLLVFNKEEFIIKLGVL